MMSGEEADHRVEEGLRADATRIEDAVDPRVEDQVLGEGAAGLLEEDVEAHFPTQGYNDGQRRLFLISQLESM